MNAPTDAQKLIAEMDGALHTMLDENEELRAQVAELQAEVKQLVGHGRRRRAGLFAKHLQRCQC